MKNLHDIRYLIRKAKEIHKEDNPKLKYMKIEVYRKNAKQIDRRLLDY
jgi:hypothetical protein